MSGVFALLAGGVAAGCTLYARSLEHDAKIVHKAPAFRSIPSLQQYLRHQHAMHPGKNAEYVSLDAIAWTHGNHDYIIRDCETTEKSEIWSYRPTPAAPENSPPGGATLPAAPASTGGWSRSTAERIVSHRSANRDSYPLFLTDGTHQSFVAVNPYSLEQQLHKSKLWSRSIEEEIKLADPSTTPPAANMLLTALSPTQPITLPPRPLSTKHKFRELRVGEPIFALGEVALTRNEGRQDSLTFSLELRDGRPVALQTGTRQAYLDAAFDESRTMKKVGYVFGGISLASAIYWIASAAK